jgi:hypothetical protein
MICKINMRIIISNNSTYTILKFIAYIHKVFIKPLLRTIFNIIQYYKSETTF